MLVKNDVPRLDGRAKVTGAAVYTADRSFPDMLHAVLVTATIPAGRVTGIDAGEALAEAGVRHVLTERDMPRFGIAPSPPLASSFMPMQGDEIRHEGQAIAIVLAETLEAAEGAARMVRVTVERHSFSSPKEAPSATAAAPDRSPGYLYDAPAWSNGDADESLATSAYRHDGCYVLSSRHASPIETSATVAFWEDDRLTCHDTVQHGNTTQFVLSAALEIPMEHVRVVCSHVGGGFGIKGYVWPHQILAAVAARICGRPVKLVLTRSQLFACVGFQPLMTQAVSLASDAEGHLACISHLVSNITSVSDDYVEFATMATKGLYAAPVIRCQQTVERHHFTVPSAVRAPMDGPGTFAVECAIDELAGQIGLDPLDLRLANHAENDPVDGRPWSSKKLREAYEEGAALFGWRREKPVRSTGDLLIGRGMATCTMGTFRFPSQARIRLGADGSIALEAGFQDIGTGNITVYAQIVADVLGVDPEDVTVRMGSTDLPPGSPTFGSTSTMSGGASVLRAAEDVMRRLAALGDPTAGRISMRGGRIRRGDDIDSVAIADVLGRSGLTEIVGTGEFSLGAGVQFDANGGGSGYAMRTFGAVFVEVSVDPTLGLLRLRRAVGSYSAGRILNTRTARSQMIGGLIWGWGQATMEASLHEPQLGRFLGKSLSEALIPVNADIPADITIHFVDEFDALSGPLGAKGIGELGATGVAAAVANAVFDATGRRLRELPITPARLLDALHSSC